MVHDSVRREKNVFIEESLKFEFKTSNNQVEYESYIIDMTLTLEVGESKLKASNDSQLVQNQVVGRDQCPRSSLNYLLDETHHILHAIR